MMNVMAILVAVMCSAPPLGDAQAESRFSGARLVVGRQDKSLFGNKGFADVEGVLVSDAQARRIRFEAVGRAPFEVAYDQILGLHYEESTYPSARRRFRSYLTIHYSNGAGETTFEMIRLPPDNVPAILAALERDTGRSIDRQPATMSFLGLPIHVGIGDTVKITDDGGGRTTGRITRLSMSSVELESSGRRDAAAIRQIEVIDSIWEPGAFNGALGIGLPLSYALWNRNYCDDCSILPSFAAGLAVGAVVGALIDRSISRHAYDRSRRSPSAPPTQRR